MKNKAFVDGIDTICLECNRANVKAWRQLNPSKRKLQQQKEQKQDYVRNKHYRYYYGCSLEDYNRMFSEQNGCCKVCGVHQQELKRRLAVDHCHGTGRIRGLLCHHCNSLLGHAKDSTETLEKAIRYLTGY